MQKQHTIYILGNPDIAQDNIAYKTADKLKKLFSNVKFLPQYKLDLDKVSKYTNLWLMDAAINLDKVAYITNLEQLSLPPRLTLHDFDIVIQLKLMQKLHLVKHINIIGIPYNLNLHKAVSQAGAIIKKHLIKI